MKSLTNGAIYYNHICLFEGIKVTQSNLQFMRLSQKTGKPFLQCKEKADKSWVLLNTTSHPVLKNIKDILRNNLHILYINGIMAGLFKDTPMTSFIHQKNLKDMVIRPILDNSLLNGGFKTCSDSRCFLYKYSTKPDSLSSPIP